jgi:glycosyltransferase involved in cell wall biosynthesis
MPQRVAIIDCVTRFGGGQQVFIDSIEQLLQTGWEVDAFVAEKTPVFDALESIKKRKGPELSIRTSDFSFKRQGLVSRIARQLKVFKLLHRHKHILAKSSACIVNDPDAFFAAAIVQTLQRRKNVVLYAHLQYDPLQKLFIYFLSKLPSICEIWCPSQFMRDQVLNNIQIVPIHVVTPRCRLMVHNPRTNFPALPIRIASIGALDPRKGHDALIDAANELKDTEFYVIGDPIHGETAYVKELVNRAPSNFHVYEHQSNLSEFLSTKGITCIVCASRDNFEAFGLTALESVALGLHTVVRRCGGLTEIAEELKLAVIETDHELVAALHAYVSDPMRYLSQLPAQQKILETKYGTSMFATRINQRCLDIAGIRVHDAKSE